MPGHYTSFQIKNTTDVPIIFTVTHPDGDVLTVGKLNPGKESIQVAPLSASWSIQCSNPDPGGNVDSPARDRQPVITPDALEMEARNETTPQSFEDSTNSEPIHYEAILKLETGSHTARINQLLVTPDGEKLITSGEDKTIRIWDVKDKKQTRVLLGQIGAGEYGKIKAIAISPDGKYIVALVWLLKDSDHHTERESDLRVFELTTGNLQARFHYPGELQDLDFSPDGNYLAIISNPKQPFHRGFVQIYDTSALLEGFGEIPAPIASDALYEDNALIPAQVRFIPDNQKSVVDYRIVVATWILDGPYLGYGGKLIWYSFSTSSDLEKILQCDTEENVPPENLAVSREFVILTSAYQQKFYCYDHSGKLVATKLCDSSPAAPIFSQDGSQLIVGQSWDSALVQVRVYDTALGQFQLKSTYYDHDAEVIAVALLQDGTAVSAGGDRNSIHFWNTAHLEGEQIAVIQGAGRVVYGVGVNEQEQIGIGNHRDLRLEDGNIILQRVFDLPAMTLKSIPFVESATFQRAQVLFEDKRLERIGADLYILPDVKQVLDNEYYDPVTFGFTKAGTIVAGDRYGRLRVFPRTLDSNVRFLVGHTACLLDHAASSKWLVTTGKDQVIRLWYIEDVEQGVTEVEPALNLFVGMDDEWVLWSKSGYYTASQNGDRYLGYHINRGPDKEALFFSSDRFHTVFFRPDIIQAILIHGSEERVSKKEAESQISIRSINVEEILPPIIELDEKGMEIYEEGVPTQGFVNFTLTAESHGRPITRLCVLRNGRLIYEEKSVPSSGKMTIPRLTRLPGENRFKIFAEIQDAQLHAIKSNPIEQTLIGKGRFENEDVLENGMLYILAIGVSKGVNLVKRESGVVGAIPELRYAHKDADAIYNAFSNNKAFEGVERKLLVNEEATLAGILKALDEIDRMIHQKGKERFTKGEKAKRDVLLVFLSGHGAYRPLNQQLYFWNYDYDGERLDDTGLSFMELGKRISLLPADVILMTDACHSGMAGSDVAQGVDPNHNGIDPNELAKRIYGINERDMYILNAARRSEFANEAPSVEHGYFTKAILDSLVESTNSGVTMLGLMDQVQWRVPNDKQHPVCRIYGDLLSLVIYKSK